MANINEANKLFRSLTDDMYDVSEAIDALEDLKTLLGRVLIQRADMNDVLCAYEDITRVLYIMRENLEE